MNVVFRNITEALDFSRWENEMQSSDWEALDSEDEMQLLYGGEAR